MASEHIVSHESDAAKSLDPQGDLSNSKTLDVVMDIGASKEQAPAQAGPGSYLRAVGSPPTLDNLTWSKEDPELSKFYASLYGVAGFISSSLTKEKIIQIPTNFFKELVPDVLARDVEGLRCRSFINFVETDDLDVSKIPLIKVIKSYIRGADKSINEVNSHLIEVFQFMISEVLHPSTHNTILKNEGLYFARTQFALIHIKTSKSDLSASQIASFCSEDKISSLLSQLFPNNSALVENIILLVKHLAEGIYRWLSREVDQTGFNMLIERIDTYFRNGAGLYQTCYNTRKLERTTKDFKNRAKLAKDKKLVPKKTDKELRLCIVKPQIDVPGPCTQAEKILIARVNLVIDKLPPIADKAIREINFFERSKVVKSHIADLHYRCKLVENVIRSRKNDCYHKILARRDAQVVSKKTTQGGVYPKGSKLTSNEWVREVQEFPGDVVIRGLINSFPELFENGHFVASNALRLFLTRTKADVIIHDSMSQARKRMRPDSDLGDPEDEEFPDEEEGSDFVE